MRFLTVAALPALPTATPVRVIVAPAAMATVDADAAASLPRLGPRAKLTGSVTVMFTSVADAETLM